MIFKKIRGWAAVWLGVACSLSPALAGTVITANLPPNTAIVNINATQDGAASYNGDQSLWYHPFSTGGTAQLLEYTVQPGTYTFRVINPADAVQLFPALTAGQTNQIFTAWTFNSPWGTDYLVYDSAAAVNTALPQLFDGAFSNTNGTWQLFGNASAAYSAAVSEGLYDLIRPGPAGRDGTIYTTGYTFATNETLIFVVPDYALSDNAGGVSVLVSPVTLIPPVLKIVPGPGTVTLEWATNASGYNLQLETNRLSSPWGFVTNSSSILGTNFAVTLPISATNRFFRLFHY
jgi:hypothetical protein